MDDGDGVVPVFPVLTNPLDVVFAGRQAFCVPFAGCPIGVVLRGRLFGVDLFFRVGGLEGKRALVDIVVRRPAGEHVIGMGVQIIVREHLKTFLRLGFLYLVAFLDHVEIPVSGIGVNLHFLISLPGFVHSLHMTFICGFLEVVECFFRVFPNAASVFIT